MKIINVITRLNIGGASPPVISLASRLRGYGHDSLLVAGTPGPNEGSMDGDAERTGVEFLRIPALRRDPSAMDDARAFGALVQLFRARRPDVVGTHMSKAGALGRIAARAAGVKVVVHTHHAKAFYVFDRLWKERATIGAERMLSKLCSGSIVVSEKQRRDFVALGIDRPDRLKVVRYGLNLDPLLTAGDLPRTLRAEAGVPETARLVGVVGRLVKIKGQDVFIRAAVEIARQFPDVYFILAGGGDSQPEYEALAGELGLKDRFRFLGWRRDVPRVLANLDVVVLPTVNDFEGTPLAVIEALAAGRPVVATDVGGVSEVIKDGATGLLIPIRDPEALAHSVARLLNDPQTARSLAAAGRALVSQQYREADMVANVEAYYKELAASRR
jgi:glycosyltransferase involved in cell wall biosynthesis